MAGPLISSKRLTPKRFALLLARETEMLSTGEDALTRIPEFTDFYWQDFYNLLIIGDLRGLAWNIGRWTGRWTEGGEKQ